MIFAKLDVVIWGHEKFVEAGPAAVGVWAASLAWLREHESSEGYLPPAAIRVLLGLGERDARKLCERLVEVGLFAAQDRGYVLLGYATKNETKEQIASRRAASKARTDAWRRARSGGAGNGVGNEHGDGECNALQDASQTPFVTLNVQRTEVVRTGSGSDSLSGSVSDRGEPERGHDLRAVTSADPLPAELREAAKMLSVQDVDGAWLKFCGHFATQTVNVPGRWQAWCVREAKAERTERDRRNNPRYTPPGAPDQNQYDGPKIREERARRERERREAEKHAVPIPMGDLMAAVGGARKP